MSEKPYQICTNCIMDTSDPEITFDENGVCIIVENLRMYQNLIGFQMKKVKKS